MINNKETLKRFGYTYDSLSNASKKHVWLLCDYCGLEVKKTKQSVVLGREYVEKDACVKCKFKKREDVSMAKHGVKNSAQRKDVREKIVGDSGLIENYDKEIRKLHEEGYSASYISEKLEVSRNSLIRYLNRIGLELNDLKEVKNKTSLEKYGKDYKKEFQKRSVEAVKKKYGVENTFQSEEIKQKIKESNLENNGCEYPMQNESIREKSKQTCIEKYGTESPLQNEEIKERIRNTNIEKYGTEYPTQSDVVKAKARKTLIAQGKMREFNGKSIKEWALENGFSRTRMDQLERLHGFEVASTMLPYQTSLETVMETLLQDIGIDFQKQFRVENRRADFFIPSKNIIIEVDGNYWHSEINREDDYHQKKRNLYFQNNYRPFFFREDEILNKLPIVKSIILNALGRAEEKIGARKCEIAEIPSKIAASKLEENHLMGAGQGRTFVLTYDGEIVSMMQLKRIKGGDHEISRFCNKLGYSVPGSFSRLLKHVESTLEMDSLKTFIDLRYGTGSYLRDFGFVEGKTHLSFKWTNGAQVFHRMKFWGSSGYEKGLVKIWDCGQTPYIKSYKEQTKKEG